MARRKLSPKHWAALNRGRPVTNYPQGGGRAQVVRMFGGQERHRRRKGSG